MFFLTVSISFGLFLSVESCNLIYERELITNKIIMRSLFVILLISIAVITYRLAKAIYTIKFNYQQLNELGVSRTVNFLSLLVVTYKLFMLRDMDDVSVDLLIVLPAVLGTFYLAFRLIFYWAFWCVDGFLNKK